jgi:N-acetylglucosaminyldiphosphoundecaprenol N-acetyl-beta-D-mannosaminyltransferase
MSLVERPIFRSDRVGGRMAAVPAQSPLYWLLGLPFDCIGVEEARRRILEAIAHRTKLVFATPNVNFLAESHRDERFRKCIWSTQMSLADGMPLVWLGRLLGIPFPQRVAGSTLVERLQRDNEGPGIRVFFFGGLPGVAKAACEALARRGGGLIAAGWCDPGFVSIEDMSSPAILESINAAKPDLIIVALGAKKGHFWIERNSPLLEAPVISHLGATVGFVAGHLRRAPSFFQATGFEWLWRTMMEPHLAMRYVKDGFFLLSVVIHTVVPLLLYHLRRHTIFPRTLKVETVDEGAQAVTVRVDGVMVSRTLAGLIAHMAAIPQEKHVTLDLSGVRSLDSRAVGYLYGLVDRQPAGRVSVLSPAGSRIEGFLALYGADAMIAAQMSGRSS